MDEIEKCISKMEEIKSLPYDWLRRLRTASDHTQK